MSIVSLKTWNVTKRAASPAAFVGISGRPLLPRGQWQKLPLPHQPQHQQRSLVQTAVSFYYNNPFNNAPTLTSRHSQHLYHHHPFMKLPRQQKQQQHKHSQTKTTTTTITKRTMTKINRVWDKEALADLFDQYAQSRNGGNRCLNCDDIRSLLSGIGEIPADETVSKLFAVADADNNGLIDFDEFLEHAELFLADNPARIILVVGGPGSGKGMLSKRLQEECNVVHLSSGDLLRQEVALDTKLGRVVRDIMSRGELVSSAIMVALMKKRMKDHPGKRVLLDGFPRSIENASDLIAFCGKPELALHLECDDTILMERIMGRGAGTLSTPQQIRREDDNFQSALQRLRTFHSYHHKTIDWLKEHHVPIVNLDCSGTQESVWQQLVTIGRLMRHVVKLPSLTSTTTTTPPASALTNSAEAPPNPNEDGSTSLFR